MLFFLFFILSPSPASLANRRLRFTLHPSVSLRDVAEKLPFTYTGADFYALCSDAMLKAVTRQATQVDAKIKALNAQPETRQPMSTAYFFDHHATAEDVAVTVTEQDFMDAHRELVPSVSAGELIHYERVRATFEGARDAAPVRQGPGALSLDKRSASAASKASLKGKGKAVAGKGKGRATSFSSGDEDDGGHDGVNGERGKGKGKAPATFQEQRASDDEGLYE